MTVSEALVVIADLAQGIDPIEGKTLPPDSLYRHPEVSRALFLAAIALEKAEQRQEREKSLPSSAGKGWSEIEDEELCARFDQKTPVNQIARLHGRTAGAIQSRLAKLGKITMPAYKHDR